MEEKKRDLEGLIGFLEFAKKNGYVNASTGDNRIRIARDVLTTVPNININDVTKLDIEDIYTRYATLTQNKLPASTLQANKSHLKSSIREFSTYLTDPVHYKPSGKGKKESTTRLPSKRPSEERKSATSKAEEVQTPKTGNLASPTIHIDFQIHISPDTDEKLVEKIFESLSKYFPTKLSPVSSA